MDQQKIVLNMGLKDMIEASKKPIYHHYVIEGGFVTPENFFEILHKFPELQEMKTNILENGYLVILKERRNAIDLSGESGALRILNNQKNLSAYDFNSDHAFILTPQPMNQSFLGNSIFQEIRAFGQGGIHGYSKGNDRFSPYKEGVWSWDRENYAQRYHLNKKPSKYYCDATYEYSQEKIKVGINGYECLWRYTKCLDQHDPTPYKEWMSWANMVSSIMARIDKEIAIHGFELLAGNAPDEYILYSDIPLLSFIEEGMKNSGRSSFFYPESPETYLVEYLISTDYFYGKKVSGILLMDDKSRRITFISGRDCKDVRFTSSPNDNGRIYTRGMGQGYWLMTSNKYSSKKKLVAAIDLWLDDFWKTSPGDCIPISKKV